jgi:hypothetical protein
MVAVLGPYEALPYYIHTYIHKSVTFLDDKNKNLITKEKFC